MTDTSQQRFVVGLGAFQLFIGVGGIVGGAGLVLDPAGASQGMPRELLADAPFGDYLIPGLVLLIVIGAGMLAGGVLSLRRHRYAGEVAVVLGVLLLVWIAAQVWWIGLLHWLQPVYFGFGLIQMVTGLLVRARSK